MSDTVRYRKWFDGLFMVVSVLLSELLASPGAQAQNYKILHSFSCFTTDGVGPVGNLVRDSAGNLYGTTGGGGDPNGDGTVFEISPSGTETVLYRFAGMPDGQQPRAGLIRDAAGNLYGTTAFGGATNNGTVFKISPSGVETVLYSFGNFPDALNPEGGLAHDGLGNLYGTTLNGGVDDEGAVFKLTPAGAETVLFSFDIEDGQNPVGNLIRDTEGNLYGTTYIGGAFDGGTVFELKNDKKEVLLHSFPASSSDGAGPMAGVLRDAAGNLYGTAPNGGTQGGGVVFKVDTTDTETVLFSFVFGYGNAGYYPSVGLIEDRKGNLYGTTVTGGFPCNEVGNGCGAVFKLSPSGQETTLHEFKGYPTDGAEPMGDLLAADGNLYGTTGIGGANGCGTVFEFTGH